jgi:ATP-dependent Lhr-like helicase
MDFVTRGGPTLEAYPQYRKVVRERGRCVVTSTPIERLHRMSIGTITSEGAVQVRYVNGRTLGTIEESFLSRLRPGDRFVFAGRVVELVRLRDMTAHVKRARSKRGIVPRWVGGRSPLSTQLAEAVRERLDEARRGVYLDEEMELLRPLLELQARWSVIPARDELLIETTSDQEAHHVFVFTLAGRLVNEGLAALLAHRVAGAAPRSITATGNDYGVELVSIEPFTTDEAAWRERLGTDSLVEDLLACLNDSELTRRHFREIARVAGLIFAGYPGQPKPARHLQASSNLFFEVFTEFDPANLLLDQARREVLDRELEVRRLRRTLERAAEQRIIVVPTRRFTPLSFPLCVERMRSQHVTSEKWQDRVQRMVVKLEDAARRDPVTSRA